MRQPAARVRLPSYLIWIDTPQDERRRRFELRPDWAGCAAFAHRWARQEAALQATADTPGRADLVVDNSEKRGDRGWGGQFLARVHR